MIFCVKSVILTKKLKTCYEKKSLKTMYINHNLFFDIKIRIHKSFRLKKNCVSIYPEKIQKYRVHNNTIKMGYYNHDTVNVFFFKNDFKKKWLKNTKIFNKKSEKILDINTFFIPMY